MMHAPHKALGLLAGTYELHAAHLTSAAVAVAIPLHLMLHAQTHACLWTDACGQQFW
jgi:hypothetical protein